MKVLTATRRSQGVQRTDVFSGCIECEPVWIAPRQCDGESGLCTCTIGFTGMETGGVTTTAMVRNVPMLDRRRFVRQLADTVTDDELQTMDVDALADELIALAASFPERTIVDRMADDVRVRVQGDADVVPTR